MRSPKTRHVALALVFAAVAAVLCAWLSHGRTDAAETGAVRVSVARSLSAGVVDVERARRESKAGRAAVAHLEEVRQRLRQGLDDFQKSVENEPRGDEAAAKAKRQLEERLRLYEAAAWGVVNAMLSREAENWLRSHPGALVVARQSLLASDGELDITAELIAAMDATDPVFAPLPVVNVERPSRAAPAKATPAVKAPARKQAPAKTR
jgi:Skp family chaperone for outer membrane proteins